MSCFGPYSIKNFGDASFQDLSSPLRIAFLSLSRFFDKNKNIVKSLLKSVNYQGSLNFTTGLQHKIYYFSLI